MKTLVAVPVKDPRTAKARLAGVLSADERRRLAERTFERLLDVLCALPSRPDLLVVTDSAAIEARARADGAEAIRRPAGADGGPGQTAAVSAAAAWAVARGYDRMLALPADIADPDPGEIEALLALDLPPPSVALVPARDGGTNALLAAPPEAIPFRFGADSLEAHVAEARARGVRVEILRLRRLALDIDTPDDLRRAGLLERAEPAPA